MELEQLYMDANLLCNGELSLQEFLLYYDMVVSRILTRDPKRMILPEGEYVRPETLEGSCVLPDNFYFAILYFIGGTVLGNECMFRDSDARADEAFRAIWREVARGKRLAGDRW